MKQEIIRNIEKPEQLEILYRKNMNGFRHEFNLIYPDIKDSITAQIWNERLNYEKKESYSGSKSDIIFIIIISIVAGLIAKIPEIFSINNDFFYPRNISLIVFPALTAYFVREQKIHSKKLLIIIIVILCSALYINLLPKSESSDTLLLACIHLPIILWAVLGYTFSGNENKDYEKRLEYLRYNGDLIVMTALILISGAILTLVTFQLFRLIDINIEEIYSKYIGIWGLAAAPIVGTYLVKTNPQLVNKISPVLAKIFSPLVFLTLVVYLFSLIVTGKDPYQDREFLLIFNILLIGVMAIILFSISEIRNNSENIAVILLLLGISVVTIIVNGIALSAIIFRISEWGFTPNRLAVLGGNILILSNLVIVTYRLYKTIKDRSEIEKAEKCIAGFLPVYVIWAIVITFLFPLFFGFK